MTSISPLFSSTLIKSLACPIKWIESTEYLMARVNQTMNDMIKDIEKSLNDMNKEDDWRSKE